MEERLRRDIELQRGIGLRRRTMAELYATELLGIRSPLGTSDELRLTTQLALYLTLFHLCGILHLFHASLSGESLLISSFYGIAHIEVILSHEDSICRHKRQERYLILTYRGKLWHYLHPIPQLL